MSDTSIRFKFFDKKLINDQLLLSEPFVNALHMIETSIGNPHLSVKFAQTCVASLRNEPLFDPGECRRHISEIYSHLVYVLQRINLEITDFTKTWSTLSLCHKTSSSFDIITIDRATIMGAAPLLTSNDDDGRARVTFFFFAKLLHELAHACIAELGRRLPIDDYPDPDDRFESPTTHGLAGEAGDAIERHFFGSVVDAIGHYTEQHPPGYCIDQVLLRERQKKKTVTADYLRQFFQLNLATIKSIPRPETEISPVSVQTRSKRRSQTSSPSRKKIRLGDEPLTKSAVICAVNRTSQSNSASETTDSDDDNEKPVLHLTGKIRYPVILCKE